MRLRTAFVIFAALNLLWAAAFIGYAFRSRTPGVGDEDAAPILAASRPPSTNLPPASNAAPALTAQRSVASITNAPGPKKTAPHLVASSKQYGWQDVTNAGYRQYIENLRAVGCPEKQVRNIIISDVNDLFDQRRLEYAIRTDVQWWKADTYMGVLPMQPFAAANLDQERRDLLEQLLGEEWEKGVKLPSFSATTVNLTGPVLGALPANTWNEVQEICARSMERHQAALMARFNQGGAQVESTEMAKLRNQTRTDLAQILTPDELEEFLLRYSHNSSKLRQDTRGLDMTPDEFRKIFRALDPIEHQMQLDYGGPEALSIKQREQFDSQRDRIIQEVLPPEKYQQYLLTKDPAYRQAQLTAMQYGMNARAVQALYQLHKNNETRRSQISQNQTLTPQQKQQALQSINLEQNQTLQRMLGDVTYRR